MIKIENINKSYDSLHVLKNVNMQVEEGEIVSIIGASGAGKTTLLQIIGTLDRPDSGTTIINNINPFSLKEKQLAEFRNSSIGFIFQFHQLLPEFSAIENIMIPALIGGRNAKDAEHEAKKLLEFMKLSKRASHKPAELSGGEKQRIAVARALINKPKILLADEPSGSLDSENKTELHNLFFDLRDNFGQTTLIVTHDESLAQMSDRTIQMRDGKII